MKQIINLSRTVTVDESNADQKVNHLLNIIIYYSIF